LSQVRNGMTVCICTPAVNFINVKRTNFSYERRFGSFYYVHVTAKTTFVQKIFAFNVDDIDGWRTYACAPIFVRTVVRGHNPLHTVYCTDISFLKLSKIFFLFLVNLINSSQWSCLYLITFFFAELTEINNFCFTKKLLKIK